MNSRALTARMTGLWYLSLGLAGGLGFLMIRNQLFVPDDPGATLANLADRTALARAGIGLELTAVAAQAMAGLWFYRLFRSVDAFAAGALAAFSFFNAMTILASAAFLATAVEVATDTGLAPSIDVAATAQVMYLVSNNLWGVGSLFFGLWLIPMGLLVLRSGWLPRPLGWVLVVGGAGYLVSTYALYLAPGIPVISELAVIPATIGEVWIIIYLLWRGVLPTPAAAQPVPALQARDLTPSA